MQRDSHILKRHCGQSFPEEMARTNCIPRIVAFPRFLPRSHAILKPSLSDSEFLQVHFSHRDANCRNWPSFSELKCDIKGDIILEERYLSRLVTCRARFVLIANNRRIHLMHGPTLERAYGSTPARRGRKYVCSVQSMIGKCSADEGALSPFWPQQVKSASLHNYSSSAHSATPLRFLNQYLRRPAAHSDGWRFSEG
jgi:hypothetical protein